MNFDALFSLVEKMRAQTIGEPVWISSKSVFEYSEESVQVVAVLKLIRAAHGIESMRLLCANGLLIDMGAIFRCVSDCSMEVYFLLENYPKSSSEVEQFVKSFFETTIDNYDSRNNTPYVAAKKIHNAMVRVLTGQENHQGIRDRILRVYKAFSGYTHANYAHIMQNYGGTPKDFNLSGIRSAQERIKQMQIVGAAYYSTVTVLGFAALKFGLKDLNHEIIQLLES
jgi:hypothetical protein